MKTRAPKKAQSSKSKTPSSKSGATSFLLEIGSEELPWQMIQPAMTPVRIRGITTRKKVVKKPAPHAVEASSSSWWIWMMVVVDARKP